MSRSAMTSKVTEDLKTGALIYHQVPRPGKLEILPTKPLGNQRDLALAYSPGCGGCVRSDCR